MQNRILVPILLVIATLAVFWPAQNYGFVNWDDDYHIYENRYLNPVSVENTLHFWAKPHENMYIPATYTAWAMLGWLSQYYPAASGLNPHIFHTANLIVHLLSVLMVFGILRILLRHGFREKEANEIHDSSKVEIAAGIGALIFALHPVQVEPVVWITSMKGLLCGLFSFIAIREYLAYAFASAGKGAGANKKSHYILACAAFLLALLSKPTAVVVPLVLLILDRWAVKRSLKESALALAGWFIAAFVFAVITKSVQYSGAEAVTVPLWARPFIAGDALAFYLYKIAIPWQLGIDYGRSPGYVLEQWWGYATWLFPVALVGIVWFLKERKPILASMGIFAAVLFPVLGFVPFLFQSNSTVADRYLYIAMLGVALFVSWIILNSKTRFVMSLSLLVILLFGVRSSIQVRTWKDETALYVNALKVNPVSPVSYNNMGLALAKQGKPAEAIVHYKEAIKIRPNVSLAHYNLGLALTALNRQDEAISHFKKALTIRPDNAKAHNNLAIALNNQGKVDEAIAHFKAAVKILPSFAVAHYNLGIALKKRGKLNEAAAHFSEVLRIRPQFTMAKRQLAIVRAGLGNK